MNRLLVTLTTILCGTCSLAIAESVTCSEDWYVTGYYTPVENNFPSLTVKYVFVDKHGWQQFPAEFVQVTRLEGWGKTKSGWYLGYYSKKWHRSDTALDAFGKPLTIGTIATDSEILARGQRVNIPAMQQHLSKSYFVARDRGSAINQRHIDVYTGEGLAARQLTLDVTSRRHTVCIM